VNNGLLIRGKTALAGAQVSSHGDHRISMMLVIAGLIARGNTSIENLFVFDDSYPEFLKDLGRLQT
jgi:3-phosphoshikimate 1-carboxyvinyltransferase